MVGLQHGVATVSTYGSHTDTLLRARNDAAFVLTPHEDPGAFAAAAVDLARDPARRTALGDAGRALFDACFTWDRLADGLLAHLQAPTAPDSFATAHDAPFQSLDSHV